MEKNLKIKLITYNVGDKSAEDVKPSKMFDFIKLKKFDFVFIGLQEVVSDSTWTSLIKRSFGEHGYVLFKCRNIWAIWLYGLVKRVHLPMMDHVESEVVASGYGGVLGNKGGVSIRLRYNNISMAVVNAHFTAHEEGFKDRLNDYLDIVTNQSFRDKEVCNLLDHDYVFWMGDLNFRLENISKEEVECAIKNRRFADLLKNDQLIKAMKLHSIFKDFKEGELNFPPTFKFDDNCDIYDTSKKQRKPAWTDRILYMVHNDDKKTRNRANLRRYYSEPDERGSDHRPVCADVTLSFRELYCTHLPVQFEPVTGKWNEDADESVQFRYRVLEDRDGEEREHEVQFRPDRWDYVALVSANWTVLLEDIITYSYVPVGGASTAETLSGGNGGVPSMRLEIGRKYLGTVLPRSALQLVYYSKKMNCIQGYSAVFRSGGL